MATVEIAQDQLRGLVNEVSEPKHASPKPASSKPWKSLFAGLIEGWRRAEAPRAPDSPEPNGTPSDRPAVVPDIEDRPVARVDDRGSKAEERKVEERIGKPEERKAEVEERIEEKPAVGDRDQALRDLLQKSREDKTVTMDLTKALMQLKALRAQGWTAEALEGIESLRAAHKLASYEPAVALFEKQHPEHAVMTAGGDIFGTSVPPFLGQSESPDDDDKLLVQGKDSWKAWQKGQIRKFFDEKRNGTLRV
jgi:hypothetical protein